MENPRSKAKGSGRSWKVGVGVVLAVAAGLLIGSAWWFAEPSPLDLARSAYDDRIYDQAAELARGVLKARPDDLEAVRLLARSTSRLGRDTSSESLYQRLDPNEFEAEDFYLQGSRLGRLGRLKEAIAMLEAARAKDPNHAETLETLARIYTKEQRLDDALKAADDLARQPGSEVSAGLMAGILHVQMNDPAGAIAPLETALGGPDSVERLQKTTSDPSPFQKVLARSLLRVGRGVDAEKALGAIVKAKKADEETEWLLSRALLQQGRINEAAEARERSKTYGSDHLADPEPALYVGEKACAPCHSKIFEESAANRHTQSYIRGADLLKLPLPDAPLPDPADPAVTHLYKKVGDHIEVETKVGPEVYQAVVDYAFGTPDRYVTMTKRNAEGEYRACRLSYYNEPNAQGWDLSAGDAVDPSHDGKFLGRPVASQSGVMRCLYCHTTNTRGGKNKTGPETADHAIGCERCHGPGGNHLAAVAAGFPDLAISSVKPTSADEVTKLCADCHNLNPPEVLISTPRSDPGWVRSPGITLTWSRCYTESAGALTCLTCHDPHQSAKASIAKSERACLSCHAGTPNPGEPRRTPCPVNPSSRCLECHMPAVFNKSLHLSLTDHFIRVRETLLESKHDKR